MLWVPVVEIEGLRIVGRRGFVEGDGLAVGEEAAADWGGVGRVYGGRRRSRTYFFGFGFGFGFGVWELGAEGEEAFLCFVFSSFIGFFHHNASASSFSLVTNLHCCLMLCLTY